MDTVDVSKKQLFTILTDLLRYGIRGRDTVCYRNVNYHIHLFVEPDKNLLEVYVKNNFVIGIYFKPDNVEWGAVRKGQLSLHYYSDEVKIRNILESEKERKERLR